MTFSPEELERIVGQVQSRIYLASQSGELEGLLKRWGLGELLSPADSYEPTNDPAGWIYVLGDSRVDVNILRGVAADMGIAKGRLRFLGYDEAQSTDCRNWQYNMDIAAIVCGPLPHKCTGMGDNSSLVEALKSEPGYPPVHEMVQHAQGGELKITKSAFREALASLMNNGKIVVDL